MCEGNEAVKPALYDWTVSQEIRGCLRGLRSDSGMLIALLEF